MFAYIISFFVRECPRVNDKNGEPRRLLNMTDFKYLIGKPPVKLVVDGNGTQLPTFIVIIHSNPYHEMLRNGIRESWGRADPRALVYFALGAVNTLEKQKQIEDENKKFEDIIQGNFYDVYHNLSYKHTMVLKWFKDNANGVKFLVKMDDDVYANIPGIYKLIMANKDEKEFLAGPYVAPERTHRIGKYALTYDEWKEDWVPPYAIGNYLIYSLDTVEKIYEKSKTTRWFWLDDVFLLGFCRMQLNIPIIDIKETTLSNDEMEAAWVDTNFELRDNWLFSPPDNHEASQAQAIWNKLKQNIYVPVP